MIRLVLIDPEGRRSEREFDRSEITIGRAQDSDLVLSAAEVARRHMKIVEKAGSVLVVDLESPGGICINGHRANRPSEVGPEDRVRVGSWTLQASTGTGGVAFGSYLLLKRLDDGLVETWLARPMGAPSLLVDLERTRPRAGPDEVTSELLVELRQAAKLSHPNITQVFEVGNVEDSLFLVREHHPGRRLTEVLSRASDQFEAMPLGVAAQIASDLCAALQHAHDQGRLHRKLGAEGIEVGLDGVTRVVDFALLEAVFAGDERDRAGVSLRGLQSLAPEYVTGKACDARADVFSVGAILFRCVAGKAPFDRGATFETLRAILEGEALPLRMERPDVRPELAHYVKVALSKSPEQRWPSARVFGAALEAFIDSAGGGGAAAVAQWMRKLFAAEAEEPARAASAPKLTSPEPALAAEPAREELPPELERWAHELRTFPPDLARTLGPWLQRIELALGPSRQASGQGDGEPDGLGGLARRGSYERLLLSEWLLATEMPEEFLRRASMDEHLFLETARRKPQGVRRAVALFDAGPSQLGTPRLAHLAALIVLSSRAKAAGDLFAFGLLGDENRQLWNEVSRASVAALLAGRSARESDEQDLKLWREATAPAKDEDLWLVGGARLERLARGAIARLEVRDVIEPGVRQLQAVVHRPGSAVQSVMLDLPDGALCARMLRDPFGVPREAPVQHGRARIAAGSPLLLPSLNRRVLALTEDGGVVALSVPSSPKVPPGQARVFTPPKGEHLLAAGMSGRRIIALTQSQPTRFSLWGLGSGVREGRPCTAIHAVLPVHAAPGMGMGTLFRVSASTVVARVGAAALLIRHDGYPDLSWIASRVSALGPALGALTLVERQDGGATVNGHRVLVRNVRGDGSFDAFVAGSGSSGVCALQDRVGQWLLLHGNVAVGIQERRIPAPPGRVVGVVNVRTRPQPGLLALEPSRRNLVVHGDGWALALPASTGPITTACSSMDGDLAAWLSETGEVGVFSFIYGRMLLRYQPQVLEQAAKARPVSA